MSLIKKRMQTKKQLASIRKNQKLSHGPATAAGRERLGPLRLFVQTGEVTQEMLKMQDDPDESLKTKGNLRLKKFDPDGCLKIKELL
jgi:hypothetical protein